MNQEQVVMTQDIIDNNKHMYVMFYDKYDRREQDFIKQVTVDELKEMLDDDWEITLCTQVNSDYFINQPHDARLHVQNDQMIEWFKSHDVTKMYHAETPQHGVVDIYII